MTPAFKEYINAWLQKAEHDIIRAQRLLEIEPMIMDNACFHCQQAIEKSLKGFLCYHGKDIEKTHNIIFLLAECVGFDPIFVNLRASAYCRWLLLYLILLIVKSVCKCCNYPIVADTGCTARLQICVRVLIRCAVL